MQTLAVALTEGEKEAAIAGGIAGAMVGTTIAFIIGFYIITVIATWKIFKKAGEPGWKCLIPIYNYYIMYKIVGMKNWFWWMIIITICTSIMFGAAGYNPYTMTDTQLAEYNYGNNPIVIIGLIILGAASLYVSIVYAWRTSKVFGHGVGYFIGLLLLQPIFWLILGFDKSKYNKKALKKSSR